MVVSYNNMSASTIGPGDAGSTEPMPAGDNEQHSKDGTKSVSAIDSAPDSHKEASVLNLVEPAIEIEQPGTNTEPQIDELDELGFIMLRCVKKAGHNQHWNRCVASINRVYPECQIKVIDDHSNLSHVVSNPKHTNVEVVNSEFSPGSGEMLPYYYYYTLGARWFQQAIILHDSTLVQHRLRNISEHKYVPLWHFDSRQAEEKVLQAKILTQCEAVRRVSICTMMENKPAWTGCFGAMSIIRHAFLTKVLDEESLYRMTQIVRTRHERMAVERVIPCVMYSYDARLQKNGVSGCIFRHPRFYGCTYGFYAKNKHPFRRYPVVKFWSRR